MLTRELPWHQLGVDVSSTKTSKEALETAGLDWEVDKKPIFDVNGASIENYFANTRSDDDSVLGIVKGRYNIVQNQDAFNFTDDLVGDGVSYEKAGLFHGGRAIWLLAKMPETKILEDKVDPYMIFINSHDGTGSIKVAMCPIRIVCSNALNLALSKAKRTWAAVHAGNVMYRLDEAKRALGLANDYMEALDVELNKLADEKFSDSEFEKLFDNMFPIAPTDSERKARNIIQMKQEMFDALKASDVSEFKDSKYGKLLAITDYFDHADPPRNTATFNETRWQNIATGHDSIDKMYSKLLAA